MQLTEVLMVCEKHGLKNADFLKTQQTRLGRYAEGLERMISPEGSYPVIGRSITYRFGSFHAMSDAALLHILPKHLNPAQVRCALTAIIKRQLVQKNTFDANGWLRVGFTGAQIHMSEDSSIQALNTLYALVSVLSVFLLQMLSGQIHMLNGQAEKHGTT